MGWTPFNFFEYDPDEVDFTKTTFNIKQALNNNWSHIKTLITEIRDAVAKRNVDLAEIKKRADEYRASREAAAPAVNASAAAAGSFNF